MIFQAIVPGCYFYKGCGFNPYGCITVAIILLHHHCPSSKCATILYSNSVRQTASKSENACQLNTGYPALSGSVSIVEGSVASSHRPIAARERDCQRVLQDRKLLRPHIGTQPSCLVNRIAISFHLLPNTFCYTKYSHLFPAPQL